jgi:hypothetical protein
MTGLPNLETVNDPARLERLSQAAWGIYAKSTDRMPLRTQAALTEYAKAAMDRLEHPERA